MSTVTVRAPAKVNLQLSVGISGHDGYHDLATVFQAVSLYDDVTALPGDGLTISVEGESADEVPLDESNLALRAAVTLAEYAGIEPKAHLHVHKGIPVAGGMAGGSADAAAALVALDHLWELSLDRTELSIIAGTLGSDVPFALMGHTAIGLGRGERLSPALARGRFEWVFAFAQSGLSTPAVYDELDRLRAGGLQVEPRVSESLMAALLAGDAPGVGKEMSNDLQRAAVSLQPQLAMALEVGDEYGALASQVSGSGPTVAFLARDDEHALDLAVALTSSGVCRTVRRASGPVAGAKVVEP